MSQTLIDHVYTSNPSRCSGVSIEAPLGTSDHNSIVVHLSNEKVKPRLVKRRIWLYQRADFEGLNELLMDSMLYLMIWTLTLMIIGSSSRTSSSQVLPNLSQTLFM